MVEILIATFPSFKKKKYTVNKFCYYVKRSI